MGSAAQPLERGTRPPFGNPRTAQVAAADSAWRGCGPSKPPGVSDVQTIGISQNEVFGNRGVPARGQTCGPSPYPFTNSRYSPEWETISPRAYRCEVSPN